MFGASKTSSSGGGPDPQFNYVTMLLHGDGTNGAQNNTFLDSSTNNFSITQNGNTTQGSFSPYGSNWSNYFLSSGTSYLTTTMTGQTFGTGDFTIEFWINPSSTALSDIIDTRSAGDSINAYSIQFDGTNLVFANTANYLSVPVAQFPIGAWTHVAYTRASGTMKVYVNGTQYGSSVTLTSDFTNTRMDIGVAVRAYYYFGYISNLRLVKGTAVYTSNFTPSTIPLTAISGTALLTCQSNRFIDNSSNAFAITLNGTPSIQRFNPFGTSTAYSTRLIGGSAYMDGTVDSLSAVNNTAFLFGAGDFTVECWINVNRTAGSNLIITGVWDDLTNQPQAWIFYVTTTGGLSFIINTGVGGPNVTIFAGSTNEILNNTWYHVAVTRSGNTWRKFINGAIADSTTNTSTIWAAISATYFIGSYQNNGTATSLLKGYISDVRLVKGTAVYTAAFTPPTTPLTAITNTSLLTNFTNGAIFDNAMMNDLETAGNAQISTSVVKYGTGSLAFDGTGDYLRPNAQLPFAFDTGNFTIEFWVYPNSVSGYLTFYDGRYPAVSQGFVLFYNAGFTYYTQAGSLISGGTLSASTWTHVALCRASGSVRLFVNGTQVGSTATDTTNYSIASVQPNGPFIGSNYVPADYLNGYLDEFRVTKGYARYTANFTPPSQAFSNTGPY